MVKKAKNKCLVCNKRCNVAVQLVGMCRFCNKQFCMDHRAAFAAADKNRGHTCTAICEKDALYMSRLEKENPGSGTPHKVETI